MEKSTHTKFNGFARVGPNACRSASCMTGASSLPTYCPPLSTDGDATLYLNLAQESDENTIMRGFPFNSLVSISRTFTRDFVVKLYRSNSRPRNEEHRSAYTRLIVIHASLYMLGIHCVLRLIKVSKERKSKQ